MSSELKHRRGTAAAHAGFIGAQGEITVKTDTHEIVVHDGVTPGGKTGGGYMPAGTGAVATTVQSKLRETVSVFDFMTAAQITDVQAGTASIDVTAAIQAAINSLGTYSYANFSTIGNPTARGKGRLRFPAGKYLVSSTLLFPADCEIFGDGYNSQIYFSATSGVNLFEKDSTKTTKYTGAAATTESVRFSNLLLVGSGYGSALYCNNVERFRMDNVTVYKFNNGLTLDDVGGGEGYYHYITNCNIYDNVVNLQIGTAASTFVGCYFWHSNDYALASYNIINQGNQTSFIGCWIEGRPSIAQIYNQSRGLTVHGGYSETRNFAAVGLKPFIKQRVSTDITNSAIPFTVSGINNVTYLFENFDLTASDSSGTATARREPLIDRNGVGNYIPSLQNTNMKYGVYGWLRNFTENAGSVSFDSAKVFNSYGAVKLAHDGSGNPLSLNILPSQNITKQYVGRRMWVTALVYVEAAVTSAQLVLFGGGNTVTKFSSAIVDFGNGWKLLVVDAPVVSTASFTCFFRIYSTTVGASAWITNIQTWVDGYDLIPSSIEGDALKASAAPTTGTWAQGDIVYNSAPVAGGTPGWVCTTAGTPGTWKAMANLAA